MPSEPIRPFDFARDTFAFENCTFWIYQFDAITGAMTFSKRLPKPDYAHRCFVLTRAARQFFYHVRYEPAQPPPDDATCRALIRKVVRRNPRVISPPEKQIVIPGYANLRELSTAREQLLKDECGGAWRSYVLRSHWRMVFVISREHQAETCASIQTRLKLNAPVVIHIVKFPALTINHSLLLYGMKNVQGGVEFEAYDPNLLTKPSSLTFDTASNTFSMPNNHYWGGGALDVIEIYRSWVM